MGCWPVEMTTFFISDLHLTPLKPQITERFLYFMENYAGSGEALYILGDFFEAWIGDDTDTPLSQQVCQALRKLSEKNIPVYIMSGNRDFLLGQRFADKSNAHLLCDPTVIDLYGEKNPADAWRQPVHQR